MISITTKTTMLLRPTTQSRLLLLRPADKTSVLTYRYASTAATPSAVRRSTTSETHTTSISKNTVNAPLTTLPAPLTLPTRTPESSAFSYFFTLGKAYLTFFKTGLKGVLTNFTATRPLQSRIDEQGGGTITKLVELRAITRSEMQHLLRARHDIRRLPVFGLIFLICGEFSPLVLPFVAGAVPYTCRIPKQLERERRILKEKREKSYETLTAPAEGEIVEAMTREGKQLKSPEAWHVARVLGVAPKILPFEGLARWRVKRRCEYLELDDTLIHHGGGWRAIDAGEELTMAVQERGMSTVGKSESELRQSLEEWESVRRKIGGPVRAGLWLLRPEQWKKVPALK